LNYIRNLTVREGLHPSDALVAGIKGEPMSDIAIITDSLATVPENHVQNLGIEVALQFLIWGEETLLDGVDITPDEFYQRLETSEITPTTSQTTAGMFVEHFKPHVEQGRPILALHVSSELSGTIQSAETAKSQFPDAKIEIIDTRSVSMAQGFQVLAAARAAANGMAYHELVAYSHEAVKHVGVLFVVDTLEFLHRGGRIGGAKKLLGTALRLKPVLEIRDGRVEAVENVRTKKKAIARLLELTEERLAGKENIRIAALHANAEEEAEELLQAMQKRCDPVESYISVVSPVIGTHSGPGTVGLAYCFGL
jgi:DegV family protein with EDD domain